MERNAGQLEKLEKVWRELDVSLDVSTTTLWPKMKLVGMRKE